MERDDKLQSVDKFLQDQGFNQPQPKQLTPLEKALVERKFTTMGDRIVSPLKNLNVPSNEEISNAIKNFFGASQLQPKDNTIVPEQVPVQQQASPSSEIQKQALQKLANRQIPSELSEFSPELEERDKLKKLF